MSEHVAVDRISQVVRELNEKTKMSILIECDVWFHNDQSEPKITWKLSFVGDGAAPCKIRNFKTYDELFTWITKNESLISGEVHPVLL